MGGPFSASQTAFNLFAATLEPETSRTFEGGVRYVTPELEASAAAYTVTFDNRLLAIARCAGIVGCPGSFANVGEVRSTGAKRSPAQPAPAPRGGTPKKNHHKLFGRFIHYGMFIYLCTCKEIFHWGFAFI